MQTFKFKIFYKARISNETKILESEMINKLLDKVFDAVAVVVFNVMRKRTLSVLNPDYIYRAKTVKQFFTNLWYFVYLVINIGDGVYISSFISSTVQEQFIYEFF